MHVKNLHLTKAFRLYLLLSGFIAAICLSAISVFFVAAPAFAASSAGWQSATATNCTTKGGSSNTTSINAQLVYTDPSGKTSTFTCFSIGIGPTSNQMILSDPSDSSMSATIGGGISNNADYHTATLATIYSKNGSAADNNVPVNPIYNNAGSTSPAPTTPPPTTTTSTTQQDDGCPLPNDALRWLLCPIWSIAYTAVNALNGAIRQLMYVPTDQIFSSQTNIEACNSSPSTSDTSKNPINSKSCNSGTMNIQDIYNTFRNFSIGMLIFAGLAMVLSEASGFELFASYTIKKALPRIAIAIVGIALAWPLLDFAITASNDLGALVGNIILAHTLSLSGQAGSNGLDGAFGTIIALLGAAIWSVFIGAAGIISMIFTVLLALFVGFLVLMIRMLIIFVCIIIAPLAIAASVTPGTNKLWVIWRDALLGALLMFPLLMAFLASGALLAQVAAAASQSSAANGAGMQAGVWDLFAIGAYFGPYFFIPFAFSLVGGFMGRVFGMVHGQHKGAFERLRNIRQTNAKQNMEALRHGGRYNQTNTLVGKTLGRGINRLGGNIGAGARGHFGLGARGAVARANLQTLSADAAAKMDQNFAAQLNNEDVMAAVALGSDADKMRKLKYFQGADGEARLQNAIRAAGTIHASPQMQTAGLDALVRSGKIIENRKEFNSLIQDVANGNGALEGALKPGMQYTYRQVGRNDLGRKSDYDALKEMDFGAIAKLKAKGAERLFAIGQSAEGDGSTGIINAIQESYNNGLQEEMNHFADILYNVQFNASLTPENHEQIQQAIYEVNRRFGPTLMNDARARYGSKLDRSGQGPQAPGAGGVPAP